MSKQVNLGHIGRMFNVHVFAVCQFLRMHRKKPVSRLHRGKVSYYGPADLFEKKREEFVQYVFGLFDRRSPLTRCCARTAKVNAAISDMRFETNRFEEKLQAKESHTKRLIRISGITDTVGDVEEHRIYEFRHYVNGAVSFFRWTGNSWEFVEGERSSLNKKQFVKSICERYKVAP